MEPTDFKFLEHSDLEFATRRVSFSSFLPYYAYDEKENIYYNSDNTAGFIFECQPAVFLGEQTFTVLNSLFRLVLPDFSVVQFCLYADPNIMPILNMYSDIKQTNNILLKKSIENFIKYFDEKSYILKSEMEIPVRNYRLFVSVKIPQKTREVINIKELYLVIRELLIGVGLYSHSVTPSQLLDFLRRLLNDVPSMNNDYYDNNMPINRQAIFSDTIIKRYMNYMQIGSKKYCKCITPKVFPSQVDALFSNKILGNYGGVQYDVEQYLTPYIYAVNVVYQNLTTFLHTKCNAILRQASWGSLALSLSRKKEEFVWATGELERGVKFMRIMPIFIIFSRQLEDLQKVVTRAKRIWESQGCIMQADEGILSVLFLSSLPFGLYANKENLLSIDRDFIVQNDLIPYIVPTQVDFVGYGAPVMVFSSRKGKLPL